MMTNNEMDLCKEFVSRAIDISQQELMFEIRKRFEMDPVKKKEEFDLHTHHQLAAWKIVKDIYCNNKQLIDEYQNGLKDTDMAKETIVVISAVIEKEIEEILLDPN